MDTFKKRIEETDIVQIPCYWWSIGCVEAARGSTDLAVTSFKKAAVLRDSPFWVQYMLAKSNLDSGHLGEGVDLLEAILSRYDYSRMFYTLWSVKAHYLLGLAYEDSGWTAQAADQYRLFLDIWKNADPGIPEIEDARLRLERLSG